MIEQSGLVFRNMVAESSASATMFSIKIQLGVDFFLINY